MSSIDIDRDTDRVRLQVNGERRKADADLHDTLLTVLRDQLHLTAAKRGCNQGVCGACTVSIDGEPMRACLTLAHDCADRSVQTLEGYAADPTLHALQVAFSAGGAFQCGFCTPAMLVTARALLVKNAKPDEAAVRSALSGNLCRCTGYKKIVEAVLAAAVSVQREPARP